MDNDTPLNSVDIGHRELGNRQLLGDNSSSMNIMIALSPCIRAEVGPSSFFDFRLFATPTPELTRSSNHHNITFVLTGQSSHENHHKYL